MHKLFIIDRKLNSIKIVNDFKYSEYIQNTQPSLLGFIIDMLITKNKSISELVGWSQKDTPDILIIDDKKFNYFYDKAFVTAFTINNMIDTYGIGSNKKTRGNIRSLPSVINKEYSEYKTIFDQLSYILQLDQIIKGNVKESDSYLTNNGLW